MTSKHTPAPWSRNIAPAKKYVTIFAGRNNHICSLTPQNMTDEEAEANLNLIAAAPTMYEKLKQLRDAFATAPGFEGEADSISEILKMAEGVE